MAEDQNRTYDAQYLLRLPSGLRDRIKAAASESRHSMNAEIVATLEDRYPERKYDIASAYQYIDEQAQHLEGMSEQGRIELFHEIRRKLSGDRFSVSLSNGVLKLTTHTLTNSQAEISIIWLEGANLDPLSDAAEIHEATPSEDDDA